MPKNRSSGRQKGSSDDIGRDLERDSTIAGSMARDRDTETSLERPETKTQRHL